MSPLIAVVGSINADLFVRMPRLPGRGETVAGGEPEWFPGGKGANQAVAAARLGAQVSMHGAVGSDAPGEMVLRNLAAAKVDLSQVRKVDIPTSVALVLVEETGENQIVIARGANDLVDVDSQSLQHADAVIIQHEIPESALLKVAAACSSLLCLNGAPVRDIPDELRNRVDVLIVNEHEFESYGRPTRGLVVVTAGADEAVAYQDGVAIARATPPRVNAVDTVGAGDTFVGAFVVALTSGLEVQSALTRAVFAASLSTLSHGAQSGMPTAQEVDAFLGVQ
ncbi:MAG: ribokinase [Actinomycetes bacterium]